MASSQKISQNVEILCKTVCNSLRFSRAKLCEKPTNQKNTVETKTYSQTFSHFYAVFSTTTSPLIPPNLFHFFTPIITTTINNLLK